MKTKKTNAMRLLDQNKISYQAIEYEHSSKDPVDGCSVAKKLKEDEACVFKTLVVQANTKEYFVFMLPVNMELNLKKCAKSAHVKSVEMIHVKDINKITGYIRGGCSPLGMKKQFKTFIHESVLEHDMIYFSGGKIGCQIQMNPMDLNKLIPIEIADLVKE